MAKQLSIDELMARIEEAEGFKRQAIEQLLQQRAELDAQLQRLGYIETPATKAPVKKRNRRTKAEIEAARAAGEK